MLSMQNRLRPLLPHVLKKLYMPILKNYGLTEFAEAMKSINQLVTTIKEAIPQEMIDGF